MIGSPPIGTALSFPSALSVANWFGANSNQAALAAIYFNGFAGATQLPNALLFTQYNAAAVAAYLRGGSIAGLTLAQIQALTGTITPNANTAKGVKTVVLATGVGEAIALKTGDIITFGSKTQTYAVQADLAVDASATGTVSIEPALVASVTNWALMTSMGSIAGLLSTKAVPATAALTAVTTSETWASARWLIKALILPWSMRGWR